MTENDAKWAPFGMTKCREGGNKLRKTYRLIGLIIQSDACYEQHEKNAGNKFVQ